MDKKLASLRWMVAFALIFTSLQQTASSEKPNIIYILADDLGYGDLGCYGQSKIPTPNIDKLASEGMRFTQHYSGATVCAPSRSALLTGMHTGHTAIRGNKEVYPEGQHPLPASDVTFAEILKDAGYVTGSFGKWGLGYPGSEGDPVYQGFDEFYGYNCQRYSHRYYPTHIWHNLSKVVLEGNDWTSTEVYAQDVIQEKTLEFITENKDNAFFAYVPILIPHAELIVPQDSIFAKFDGMFTEASWYGNDYGASNFNYAGYCSVTKRHATFAAMVYRLDVYVGQIRAKLKELAIEDNTIIIFTSDNGPHTEGGADPAFFDSNGALKGYKRDVYEGGIRVPFIASWPGKIQPGTVSDHVSAFWDMMPTFAEIAGAPVPEGIDGISMLPELLGNSTQEEHEYMYWEFHENNGRQAIRYGDWKAIRLNVRNNPYGALELYNLATDIGESQNVASQHPDVIAKMMFLIQNARSDNPFFNFGGAITPISDITLSTVCGSALAPRQDTLQIQYVVNPTTATDRRCTFKIITPAGESDATISEFGELYTGNLEGELKLIATSIQDTTVKDTLILAVGCGVILATDNMVQVDGTTATFEGVVVNLGDAPLKSTGFCYAPNIEPDIFCNPILTTPTNDKISASVSNIEPDVIYIVKAFATTDEDTIYSKSATFTATDLSSTDLNDMYDLGDYKNDFIFYLPLDGHANDVSGHVTPQVHGNPTYILGQKEEAMQFDGVDDYLQIPEGVFDPSTEDFTFLAWIKPMADANDMMVYQQENGDGIGRSILYTSSANWNISTYLGGSARSSLTRYTVNNWMHIALTVKPAENTMQFFINGKAEAPVTNSIEPSNGAINIGRHKVGQMNENSFVGEMDNLMLIKGNLTETQVQLLMNNIFYKNTVITNTRKLVNAPHITPNPITDNTFSIQFDRNIIGEYTTLKVCDLNGKTAYSDNFIANKEGLYVKANLKSGCYIVIVETTQYRFNSKVIVR